MKQAFNPFLPSYEYIPDGEPRLFGERVYLYGSHDRFNGNRFCMNDYVCWSAPKNDLSDWRYEGVIWRRSDDPKSKGKGEGMPAPDCIQGPDGRYYLYYFVSLPSYIGVAVCNEPSGQFKFHGYVQYPDGQLLGYKKGDTCQFDPGVYVEGSDVYLYTGLCPAKHHFHLTLRPKLKINKTGATVTLLEPDMITVKQPPKTIVPGIRNCKGTEFEKHPFFEASSMRKIHDKYYFIYSSYLGHELCYAVSNIPNGNFRFGGTLVSIGDIGLRNHACPKNAANFTGNTHGSILQLDDKFFVFYHRQTNRSQFSRQACAEKLYLDKHGHFSQAEITSCGLNDGPLAGRGTYEARIACNLMSARGNRFYLLFRKIHLFEPYFTQTGKDRNENPDQYIANIRNGCVIGFKYFEFKKAKEISVEIQGSCRGNLIISDEEKIVAQIRVSPLKTYTTYNASLNISDGVHPLYFKYKGKGYFNFKTFSLN